MHPVFFFVDSHLKTLLRAGHHGCEWQRCDVAHDFRGRWASHRRCPGAADHQRDQQLACVVHNPPAGQQHVPSADLHNHCAYRQHVLPCRGDGAAPCGLHHEPHAQDCGCEQQHSHRPHFCLCCGSSVCDCARPGHCLADFAGWHTRDSAASYGSVLPGAQLHRQRAHQRHSVPSGQQRDASDRDHSRDVRHH